MTTTAQIGPIVGMSDEEYHSSPALSSTGIRKLLDSPARFKHWTENRQAPKAAFDLGHVVHEMVLGVGPGFVAIPEDLLASNGAASTKAAKDYIADTRAAGRVPMKQQEIDVARGMAEAVMANSTARLMLEQDGDAEASVFARDQEFGFDMRARFDFLPKYTGRRRAALDVKHTAKSAGPIQFARTAADLGYDVQEVFYKHVYRTATGQEDMQMLFIVVESDAPHLVAVHQLDAEFIEIGQRRVDRARALYADCLIRDVWPGYDDKVLLTPPPMWLIYQNTDEENAAAEVQF